MSVVLSRLLILSLGMMVSACQSAAQPADAGLPLERLRLPEGFAIEVFARVPGARSLAVAEDGARVYVSTRDSEVFAVLDPERDGIANEVIAVAGGLKVPNGIAVGPDQRLYIADQHRIIRLDGQTVAKEIVPSGILPDRRHHGWRYAAFGPDGRLYVAVGAPCNICAVKGFEGTILRLRPDGHDLQIFARGVRNSVGFDWHPTTGELFFTDNGGDDLGDLIPPDELNHAPEPGLHFGYPYVYGQDVPYPQFADQAPPSSTVPPVVAFDAHVAALGIDFYQGTMFPEAWRGDAIVAQHGSWNRSDPIGYRLVRVRFAGGALPTGGEVFVDGWLDRDGSVWGRPVDLEELPDGSLLVSDDHAGVIYRITYRN